MILFRHIPNALTLGNLLCGLVLIASTIAPSGFGFGFGHYLFLLVLSLFFDLLDGWAARKLNVQSPLGIQLDSFADFVSFGLAPCTLLFNEINELDNVFFDLTFGIALLVVLVCSVLRLATYNIQENSVAYFKGLPIPTQAVGLYGILFWIMERPFNAPFNQLYGVLIAALIFGALLMVSRYPMYSFKMKLNLNNIQPLIFVLLAVVISFVFSGYVALWFGMMTYVFVSLVFRKKIIHSS